jgi:hypothetical protein
VKKLTNASCTYCIPCTVRSMSVLIRVSGAMSDLGSASVFRKMSETRLPRIAVTKRTIWY